MSLDTRELELQGHTGDEPGDLKQQVAHTAAPSSPLMPPSEPGIAALLAEQNLADQNLAAEPERSADWRAGRSFTWVTASGRALPVRVDTPSAGIARGAVVIVPSLGRESVVSYRTVRSLAVRAARAGLVALTFSLSGDGDSEDLRPADDAVAAWSADVGAVEGLARLLVGESLPVSLVGLRLGAALVQRIAEQDAAAGGERPGRGAYVVWEPVSGTSFLRHHVQLRATGVPGDPVDDGVELDGFLLAASHAESLRTLPAARRNRASEPAKAQLSPGQVHIRFEADRRDSVRLALGATYFAHVPLESLDEIVAMLPTGQASHLASWSPVREARLQVIDEDGATREVTETLVDAGPSHLPAIITTAPGVTPCHGLAMSAMGAEVKWGPGRVWTRAARDLAPSGVVSIRADRSLIGDDVDPDNAREPNPYTNASVTDVCAAASTLRATVAAMTPASDAPLPMAVAGVCAGTWSQLRAAAEQPVDTVIAVNPVHWNPDASLYTEAFFDHYHGEEAPELDNPSETSTPALHDLLHDPTRVIAELKATASREIAIRFPRIRSMMRPEVPVDRVRYLLDDVIGGTRVYLVFGSEEERIFNGKGGRRAMARAARRDVRVTIERLGNLDHSLLSEKARRDTLALLRSLLLR